MAIVYLAHDQKHDRQVAVKVLRPEITAVLGPQRFLKEIRITAQLDHPHILTLIDSGEADGVLYYVLPYVRGESLRARLEREQQLPIDEAVIIARQIASALDYAHRRGVIHRDIKPENILLHEGEAVVADFGIALAVREAGGKRITETGLSLGTPQYMSPEQATGDRELDARADIYSLGAVVYEMLAGEPPITGPTAQAIVAKLLTERPTRLRTVRDTVPEYIDMAVARALAKVPADRFTTAGWFAVALSEARPARSLWSPGRIAAVVAGALILLGAVGLLARRGSRSGGGTDPVTRSIAVLPFASLSPSPDDEFFSDGMSEELINALTKVHGLRVVPRTSAFSFKGRNVPSRAVGDELHVETLLEGTVRRAGERVRVAAQLVSVRSDSVLWSEEYERDIHDVWAVQDDIARAIVRALEVQMVGGGSAPLVMRSTRSPAAYDLYLRGRYFFGKRTAEGLRLGADYFEQAIRLDSAFAAAYSGLSDVLTVRSLFGYVAPQEGLRHAKQVASRALALDSRDAEARASLGLVGLRYDWGFEAAERELSRAAAIDPRYATAHLFLAWYRVIVGRPADAVREIQLAQQSDPLSVIVNPRVAGLLYYNHQYDQALAQLHRTLELDSTNVITHAELARTYLAQHRCAEALAELRFIPTGFTNYEAGVTGYVPASCGRRADALRALHDMEARSTREFVMASKIAGGYAALGDRDRAFQWLDRAVAQREWPVLTLKEDPLFAGLRNDPRFARVLARITPN